MKTLIIEQLAEQLNGKLWVKGDIKRIYLDEGYNTKKMSTKTYVFQRQDGTYGVSCVIDCPSQHDNWIEREQNSIIESVTERIKEIEFETENPDQSYDDYKEDILVKKEEEQNKKAYDFASKKDRLLTAKYLRQSKRTEEYTFPTLLSYFLKCTYFSSMQSKKEEITQLEVQLKPLTFNGGWAYDSNNIETVLLPVVKTGGSNKYNYYSVVQEGLEELLPESFKSKWIEAKEKTAAYNAEIDSEIQKNLQGDSLEENYSGLSKYDMYTKENSDLLNAIRNKIDQLQIA
jgi:hypothetical protein